MRGQRVGSPFLELAELLEPNCVTDLVGCCLLVEASLGQSMLSWFRGGDYMDWDAHYRWRLRMQRP